MIDNNKRRLDTIKHFYGDESIKNKVSLVIVHNDTFHCDDVFSVVMLSLINGKVQFIRTRDSDIIKTGDYVCDVGGICNPHSHRFDHHMYYFNETFSEDYDVKLSSSGLVYKYCTDELFKKFDLNLEGDFYNYIRNEIYENYLLPIDAIDNGYNIFKDVLPRTISTIVGSFNSPKQNFMDKDGVLDFERYEEEQYKQFVKAADLIKDDFIRFMTKIKSVDVKYFSAVKELVNSTTEKYIISPCIAYTQGLISKITKILNKDLLFVIYQQPNKFRIYAFRKSKISFESKCPLFKDWRGKRTEDLKQYSDFPGMEFVHSSGFTGQADNLKTAIAMCEYSIKHNE
ncbi:MYG1 [Hepatospora eriocheir]|uniref:MYG1 n=1 Tax=Hepatospora eriocheir TaxID=1081669 RepID=A0A1X0QAD6_9MICR|nr:MYG1 [Hepatospora eriocheir]